MLSTTQTSKIDTAQHTNIEDRHSTTQFHLIHLTLRGAGACATRAQARAQSRTLREIPPFRLSVRGAPPTQNGCATQSRLHTVKPSARVPGRMGRQRRAPSVRIRCMPPPIRQFLVWRQAGFSASIGLGSAILSDCGRTAPLTTPSGVGNEAASSVGNLATPTPELGHRVPSDLQQVGSSLQQVRSSLAAKLAR